ncbi:MAG: glycosyl hydrolase family 28-related protein, partial [Lentisphaerota bacterium]
MIFIKRIIPASFVSALLLASSAVIAGTVNLAPALTDFSNGLGVQRGFEAYAKSEVVADDPAPQTKMPGTGLKITKLSVAEMPEAEAKAKRNLVWSSVNGPFHVFNEHRHRLSFEVFTKDKLDIFLSLGRVYGLEGNKGVPFSGPGAKPLKCTSGPTGEGWSEVSFILGPEGSKCDVPFPAGVMRIQPALAVSGQGTAYFRNLAIVEIDADGKPVDYGFDAPTPASAPMIPDLPWEKRSDWVDVKTDITPAAIGDGIADDTEALQAAFKAMKPGTTLYLPAGTYRINKTLELGGAYKEGGISQGTIIGNGRSTKILWDGETGGVMIKSLGYTHSSYIGFVLDGRGKAETGVLHAGKMYETDMLYQHVACLNFTGEAISIGKEHEGNLETAEVLYDNCLFDHCKIGIEFTRHNDYDNTIQGCEFRNCGTGILNRRGNAYIRDSHFERNSDCDIESLGEHGSSVRRCTSYGSMMFLKNNDPVSAMTVQDCQIADWKNPAGAMSFYYGLLFDCRFYKDSKNPPLAIGGNGGRLIVSDNRTDSGAPVFV